MEFNYTCKKNIQLLISMLKEQNIKKIIISPGTTNIMFTLSVQYDDWFELYSAADERSAAYMAVGMAAETGEPVVLSCTGATASRNYYPGLTEAYYRKLPVIAVTSALDCAVPGQLKPQIIDRSSLAKDIVIKSVTLDEIKDENDKNRCILYLNQVFHAQKTNGGGPIHINVVNDFSYDFNVKKLLGIRKIESYRYLEKMPAIDNAEKIGIFIGSHGIWSQHITDLIDEFCEKYNGVVFCDHTSNFKGKYAVNFALVAGQDQIDTSTIKVDLMIDLGCVSGDYYLVPAERSWRVSEDGEIRDRFNCLEKIFIMKEEYFFEYYNNVGTKKITSHFHECYEKYSSILKNIPQIPFSNIWIAQQLASQIPDNSTIHFGILNSLRAWNFFEISKTITAYSNVGGFGIDGGISTLLGASFVSPHKLYFGVFGDLAFFYDMNSLGNRHIGKNVRIILINNGIGTEFKNYTHPGALYGDETNKYIAAAGHYGNKSLALVKHYAEDLGFKYFQVRNESDFYHCVDEFLTPKVDTSMIMEVFTDQEEESDALRKIKNVVKSDSVKQKVKNIIGTENTIKIRQLLGK